MENRHSASVNPWKRSLDQLMRLGRSFSGRERNCCFLNVAGGRFACVSGVSGFDFPDDGRAVAVCDWDGDGDLDLWVVNRSSPQIRFLRNDEGSQRPSVAFRLVGTTANRDGIGARVEVLTADAAGRDLPPLVRTLRAGEGFLAQSSKWVHFGLGDAASIGRVRVRWPGGGWEEFSGASSGHRYRLVQGSGRAEELPDAARALVLAPQPWEAPAESRQARTFFACRVGLPALPWHDFENPKTSQNAAANGPVLLNLWSSGCRPCLAELREITARSADLRGAGVSVLALCVDEPADGNPSHDRARQFLSSIDFPFPTGVPEPNLIPKLEILHGELLGRRRPFPIPSSFLVDRDGCLAVLYKGPVGVNQVLADVTHLSAGAVERLRLAVPFPGRARGPTPHANLLLLAEALREGGFGTEMVRIYEEATRQDPEDPIAQFNLGFAQEQAGRLEAAVAAYQRTVEIDPAFVEAWKSIGTVWLNQGKSKEALTPLLRAIAIDPHHASAHGNLGMALLQCGRGEEALVHFRAACEADPASAIFHTNLVAGLVNLGRRQEAETHIYEWVRAQPRSTMALLFRANYLARTGRLEEAEAGCRRAIELDPNEPEAWNSLGAILYLHGNIRGSVDAFERVLSLKPDYPQARERLQQLRDRLSGK